MSDKTKILAGFAVFVAVAAFPVWNSLRASGSTARPDLELPKESSRCVEDKAYMTANHMDLLNRWRDEVVRQELIEYSATNGQKFTKSLTGTCLSAKCHSNSEKFCTRCHNYANVEPSCWNCHTVPEGS